MPRKRPSKKTPTYESVSTQFDDQDRQTSEMSIAICERFGNALFYTGLAVMRSIATGHTDIEEHELAMGQWNLLGKQLVTFVYETGDQ